MANNSYSENGTNGMVLSGNITQNTVWPASNSPYVVLGGSGGSRGSWHPMKINAGFGLTIQPGVIVKPYTLYNPTGDTCIVAYGTLNADGAVFTSIKDDSYGGDTNGDGNASAPAPGDWGNIEFGPGTSGTIANSVLRFGGNNPDRGNPGEGVELFVNAASPTVTGTAVSYSYDKGIEIYNTTTASIHYNDVFGNANYGIYFEYYYFSYSGSVSMDASTNYWGSKHGPKPYGRGNTYGNWQWNTNPPVPIVISPWSRLPFTSAGAAYQASLGMDDYCAQCGDPINMSTGAFVYSHTDVSVPAKGTPLDFIRTYNSNDATDGPLGYGWSLNWQISPNPQANGDVTLLQGDGRWDTFIKQADGTFLPPLGHINTLIKNPDGTYKLQTPQMKVYNFDANNALSSIVNEKNETTTFTYDANQHLTAVHDPAGRTLSISYDTDNHIDHITDPAGNTVSFGYSSAGDLTSVTDQNGGVTTYSYDDYHHITGMTDPNNHTSANNAYDGKGRVVSQTDAKANLLSFSYDTANRKTTMTRQMGASPDPAVDQTSSFYHDENWRTIRETDPDGKDITFSFDSAGNRTTTTDRRGVITQDVYDGAGNITDTYKADGLPEQQHSSATYNVNNHPLTKTDGLGRTTSYSYDATGTYLQQISYPAVTNYDNTVSNYSESYTYNPDGTVATHTDKNGDITGYTYNSYGLLATENRNTNRLAADQVTISFSYDNMSRKIAETDGNGHTTTYQYDNLGNLRYVTKQVTDPNTHLLVDVMTEYQYDGAGNKIKEIDPEGKTTAYDYTTMNRLSKVTDAKLNTIEYQYDAAGNKTAVKDKNGNWSHFAFDKNNRQTSATDPENNTTTYTYDEEGNQLSITDALGHSRSKTYDSLGRVTSASEPDEGGATRTTNYAYDNSDHLIATTDPLGHTTTNAYDELGRLMSVTDAVGSTSYSSYDGLGNKTRAKDGNGHETSFAYSPNDWLISVTDATNEVTSYAYDKAGNRSEQTDAENHVTLYSYDELNRLTNEKVDTGGGNYLLQKSYTYDKAGHLKTNTTGAGTITNTYDDVSNPTGITDRQANTYSFTYDANGNQLSATDNGSSQTVSFSYTNRGQLAGATDAFGATQAYTYNSVGNLTQQDDAVAAQNFTTSYDYTPRDQLKAVTRGTDTTSYSFDASRNLSTKSYANGVITSYSHDADNRLTASTAVYGTNTLQSFSQTYDTAGNIVSVTDPVGTNNYGYDALNRLTDESVAGYGALTYSYDKTGNRTSKIEPAPTDGPALALSQTRTYWASYQDYLDHLLSVDYLITDNGPGTAYGATVTGATATNGVYLSTPVPLSVGDIAQGASSPFTLKYYIPSGVNSFSTTVYATCQDSGGASYAYPAKRTTYGYNQANQLTSRYDPEGATTSYSYDAIGALSQKQIGPDITSYTYNGLDRLTQVSTPVANVSYGYDALGRRISRGDAAGIIDYHHNAKSDLTDYETDGTGNLTGAYLRGADGLISQTDYSGQSPVTSWDLYNPHGDTSALADQNGTVTDTYRYDAFGNAITTNSLTDGYTGKWQRDKDNSTGTIRMGVREYDPALGRFNSEDAQNGGITDPQKRNRYIYVGNDPLRRLDLNGRKGITLDEAEEHYRTGGGADIDVDMSDLDFSELSKDDFPHGTKPENIQLLYHGTREAAVFGELLLTYDGNNQIHAAQNWNGFRGQDYYSFAVGAEAGHPWDSVGGIVRNCETLYGHLHAGSGTPYWINLYGEGTISGDSFSWINTLENAFRMVVPSQPIVAS